MTEFRKEIDKIPEIRGCFMAGLQALERDHSKKVRDYKNDKLEGSLDLDQCVKSIYPNSNRWDYIIGYNSKALFVEVHSAQTGEVTTMIKKLNWLKDWLNTKAPGLKKIKDKQTPFIWLSSSKVDIPRYSSEYKRLAAAGIIPKSHLSLKKN